MARQRDLQREATRELLFTTALALFDERGYDAVGIDDIVARARVARGTFYFHFPQKDDVLIELIRRSDAHIVGTISRTAAVRRGKPLRAVLGATTDAFAEVWTDKRALLPHAGAVALRRIAAVEAARDQQPLRLELVKHVAAAVRSGELRAKLPAQILADMFLLNVFAALMAWSAAATPPLPLPTILGGVIDLFLHGAAGA
ncbi:MAG: TetR/AcrR family transcriptional regulator [Deltaproteobacteria bacterium]|nr:TetR/AcrR family transcriptional regulator [Kofleriaceae bacterium]